MGSVEAGVVNKSTETELRSQTSLFQPDAGGSGGGSAAAQEHAVTASDRQADDCLFTWLKAHFSARFPHNVGFSFTIRLIMLNAIQANVP